ncbi:MAG: type II/IV secretion system ATPase subunit, partial [Candidatus Heimdallarchaeaceae archaeon]
MQEDTGEAFTDTAAVPILEETYPVSPPFSYVLIQTDPVSKRTQYMVVEIPLDSKEQAIYKKILDIMIDELDVDLSVLKSTEKAEEFLKKKIVDIIKRYRISLNESQFEKIMYYLARDLIGYGKIQPFMLDPNIEDISCDGIGIPIYVWHRKYESIATNVSFDNAEILDSFIIKLAQRANRHISIANPLLDASLPDGSRIQLTYGKEVTQRGSTFTARKFKADPFTITDLILYNTIDLDIAAYYWFTMEHNVSTLIAGGTAAGKTTLLNTISMMIKPDLKIVTIEDTAELNLAHENWIPSVVRSGFGEATETGYRRGQISMYELLRAAMRQRPDYIIVGEIRGGEAYAMFQAMSTGHRGLGTIHGDSVEGV